MSNSRMRRATSKQSATSSVSGLTLGLVERPLSNWERRVITRLASVASAEWPLVHDSLPHLVVTGGCGRGCPSFNVRDERFAEQPHQLGHVSNGWAEDRAFGFAFYVGPDERPISVDVFDNRPEGSPPNWPDPDSLIVELVNRV